MDFILVAPEALRANWPTIKTSLEAVRTKAEAEDWIDEDVYHAIKSGQSACHIAVNEHGYAGLLVTQLIQAEFSREPVFHVWIAHSLGEASAIDEGIDLIYRMARVAGAKKITFGSPRLGWQKRFKLLSATYELPLTES